MRKAALVIAVFSEAILLCGCDALSHGACSDKSSAYAAIKKEVSNNLVSPHTASFPDAGSNKLKWGKPPQNSCSIPLDNAFVDAENQFGTTIRVNYAAVAIWKDDVRRWDVIFAPSGDTFGAVRK